MLSEKFMSVATIYTMMALLVVIRLSGFESNLENPLHTIL